MVFSSFRIIIFPYFKIAIKKVWLFPLSPVFFGSIDSTSLLDIHVLHSCDFGLTSCYVSTNSPLLSLFFLLYKKKFFKLKIVNSLFLSFFFLLPFSVS